MSDPAASDNPFAGLDPAHGLMFGVTEALFPLFATNNIDPNFARSIAASALEAYHPRTRADLVNAARTIAFSLAAITLLGEATSQDMPMPQKLKVLGRANDLNRSADQSERTMMQRQRHQDALYRDEPPAQAPSRPSIAPEAYIDLDTAAEAAIAEAVRTVTTARAATSQPNPKPAPQAAPASEPEPIHNATPPAAPAISLVQPDAAIRVTGARPDAAPPMPYRQELLHQSAIQRAMDPNLAAAPPDRRAAYP